MRPPLIHSCAIALCIANATACADQPTMPAPTPTSIQIVSGDAQAGTPGYRLAQPISVRVLDERGLPAVGVAVGYTADDIGYAEPRFAVTDSNGIATTQWRLGANLGVQRLRADVSGAPAQVVQLSATASSASVRSIAGDISSWCMVSATGVLSCLTAPTLGAADQPASGNVVAPGVTFSEVTVSNGYRLRMCAVTEAGRIWCFDVARGGGVTNAAELAGVYPALHGLVGGGSGIVSPNAICGLSPDGTAYCWGTGRYGILGMGDLDDRTTPTAVATSQRFTQVALGLFTACGLTAAGEAYCWGRNDYGETGSAVLGITLTPNLVVTPERFKELGFIDGRFNSCGIRVAGGVYCWGGTTAQSPSWNPIYGPVPGPLSGGEQAVSLRQIYEITALLKPSGAIAFTGYYWHTYFGPPAEAIERGLLRALTTSYSNEMLCGDARAAASGTLCLTSASLLVPGSTLTTPVFGLPYSAANKPLVFGIRE